MYVEETRGVRVLAEPKYLPEESQPDAGIFVFSYTITLANLGTEPVQLLSRHWIITDGSGIVREVKGEGVIGEQPVIAPGASYQYSSFSPMPTAVGNMRGSYLMKVVSSGEQFHAKIPLFFLRDLSQFN